jgi:hypothetical protein
LRIQWVIGINKNIEVTSIMIIQMDIGLNGDNGNRIMYSNGYWFKREFDANGNRIYYENSYGKIIDKRQRKKLVMERD